MACAAALGDCRKDVTSLRDGIDLRDKDIEELQTQLIAEQAKSARLLDEKIALADIIKEFQGKLDNIRATTQKLVAQHNAWELDSSKVSLTQEVQKATEALTAELNK